jgi:glycosyltransferase involved in cell wall biosynthesis
LGDRVVVHGFVPDEALDAAIASAHLAINLRHPTMGEASWGILRSWSHATPALVTDDGWYRTLPDETAWKVDLADETAGIRAALDALTQDPRAFEAMGQAARARLQAEHRPDRYADRLAAALDDLPGLQARFAALDMLKRAAALGRTDAERRLLLDRAAPLIGGLPQGHGPVLSSAPPLP